MMQEQVLSVSAGYIMTASGRKRAIGNRTFRAGDLVWTDGAVVFGNQRYSTPGIVMPADNEKIEQLIQGVPLFGAEPTDDWDIANCSYGYVSSGLKEYMQVFEQLASYTDAYRLVIGKYTAYFLILSHDDNVSTITIYDLVKNNSRSLVIEQYVYFAGELRISDNDGDVLFAVAGGEAHYFETYQVPSYYKSFWYNNSFSPPSVSSTNNFFLAIYKGTSIIYNTSSELYNLAKTDHDLVVQSVRDVSEFEQWTGWGEGNILMQDPYIPFSSEGHQVLTVLVSSQVSGNLSGIELFSDDTFSIEFSTYYSIQFFIAEKLDQWRSGSMVNDYYTFPYGGTNIEDVTHISGWALYYFGRKTGSNRIVENKTVITRHLTQVYNSSTNKEPGYLFPKNIVHITYVPKNSDLYAIGDGYYDYGNHYYIIYNEDKQEIWKSPFSWWDAQIITLGKLSDESYLLLFHDRAISIKDGAGKEILNFTDKPNFRFLNSNVAETRNIKKIEKSLKKLLGG